MRATKLVAAAVALTLVGAACSSDKATNATTTKAGDTATTTKAGDTTTSGAAMADVSLRWSTRPDNQAEIDVYQKVSDELTAKKMGFSLKYEPGNSETSSYQDKIKTAIAGGTAPDVFWIPGTDLADFATKGLILNLADQAKATKDFSADSFYKEQMYHLAYDPKTNKSGEGTALWGLPRDVSTFALYINNDLIAKAGADDPRALAKAGKWDWAAFKDLSEKVAKLGGANKGFAMSNWWANPGAFINAAGGGFFNADRTACALDSKESLAGLQFVADLYKGGSAVPYGDDGEKPFQAGTVGMFLNGRWATPGNRAAAKFGWDVVTLPKGPKDTSDWLFWGAYVVNAKTAHPKEAWALVQALTTGDVQGEVAALGANIPSRKGDDVFAKFLTFNPPANNQAFLDGLNKGIVVAEGPLWQGDWPAFDKVMEPALESVIKGSKTVEEFGKTICSDEKANFKG